MNGDKNGKLNEKLIDRKISRSKMRPFYHFFFSALFLFLLSSAGSTQVPANFNSYPQNADNSASADFQERDRLPQTEISHDRWESCCGSWGPRALLYPKTQLRDAVWNRERVIAAARHFIGTPYLHRHIPGTGVQERTVFRKISQAFCLGAPSVGLSFKLIQARSFQSSNAYFTRQYTIVGFNGPI